MRRAVVAVLAWAASWTMLSGVAFAQSPTAADESKGYAEVVAQSAFGNVTSQSFGGELGVTVKPGLQVYVDAGYVRDTTPSSLSASAQAIASAIGAQAGGSSYQVKQPVTFGVAGIKYLLPVDQSRFAPYLMAGGGIGVDVALGRTFIVDLQYRFGRVFTSDGLNINGLGVGFGVRF